MKKTRFLLFLLLFSIPQIFGAQNQPPEHPQQERRYQDLSLEERRQIDEERLVLEHDAQQLERELPAFEQELQELSNQVEQEIRTLNITPQGLFHDFQQTTLIKGPRLLRLRNGTDINFGLTGKDLLKLIFIAFDAYIDSYLKKNLFTLLLADFTKSLLEHREKITVLLNKLSYNEKNQVIWDTTHHELITFIKTDGFKNFSYFDDLSLKKIAQNIIHVLTSEVSFGIQHQFFPPHEGLIGEITEFFSGVVRNNNDFTVSLMMLLQAPLYSVFGISKLVASNAPWLRNFLLTTSGFNHPFLESYMFYLIKRLMIFTRFMKQNHEFYHKKFCDYFINNLEKFKVCFSADDKTKKEVLKSILKEADTTKFLEWFIYKNKCCDWTNFWIELLITSPALCSLGKSLYTMFYPTLSSSRGNS